MTIGEQLRLSNNTQEIVHFITEREFFKAVLSHNRNEVRKFANQVDINMKDLDGWTALMYAADTDDKKMVSLLIELGADVNIQDDDGQTALMIAIFVNATKSAELLIKHGANINIRDNNGQTPLMIAALSDEPEIGELLILEGTNVNDIDNSGCDAFSIARKKWCFKKNDYFLNTKPMQKDINIKRIVYCFNHSVSLKDEGDTYPLESFSDFFISKYGYEYNLSDVEAALETISINYKAIHLKVILTKDSFLLADNHNCSNKIVRDDNIEGLVQNSVISYRLGIKDENVEKLVQNPAMFWDGFQEYLVRRGYSLYTPSHHPSTVFEYRNAVSNIKSNESLNLSDFCINIDLIIKEYGMGGSKESLGHKKHDTWINALRRFREYLNIKKN